MEIRDLFITLVSNDTIYNSDVIILLEGDGYNRCNHAVWLLKNGFSSKILFSGGITNLENGSYPFELVRPYLHNLGVFDSQIIVENKSLNTYQQAENVIELAKINNWERLILVGSHYHQYRAYLTFLKKILMDNLSIVLLNSPARELTWFDESCWGSRIDLLEIEFNKIQLYQQKNHLATFDEALKYQKWKELKFNAQKK